MGACASTTAGPPAGAITEAELLAYYQQHARGWVEAVPFTYKYYIVDGGDPNEPGHVVMTPYMIKASSLILITLALLFCHFACAAGRAKSS